MEIKLDAEAMAAVASTAIFEQMSEENRNLVLQQALQHLLSPMKQERYSSTPPKSPLQEAFELAIRQAAFTAVKEKIENDPELQAKIQELLGPLINSAMSAEAENYNTSLSEHLGSAIGMWLAEIARKQR